MIRPRKLPKVVEVKDEEEFRNWVGAWFWRKTLGLDGIRDTMELTTDERYPIISTRASYLFAAICVICWIYDEPWVILFSLQEYIITKYVSNRMDYIGSASFTVLFVLISTLKVCSPFTILIFGEELYSIICFSLLAGLQYMYKDTARFIFGIFGTIHTVLMLFTGEPIHLFRLCMITVISLVSLM